MARAMSKRLSPRIRDRKKSQSAPTKARVGVAVSPMKRALLTSIPIIQALEEISVKGDLELAGVEVVPHIFENGGCYSETKGVFVGHRGMTKAEVAEILPIASVPNSMEKGWWMESTRESETQL